MKVFLITPEGEQGPLTIDQIDCLNAEGKLNPDQHCRVEWDKEKKNLRDVMAAAAARKQILAYQANSWRAKQGTVLLSAGLVLTIFFNPYNLGDALLILGIVITAYEQARLQRAVKELSNLHTDSNLTLCTKPADESVSESRGSSSSESNKFDY